MTSTSRTVAGAKLVTAAAAVVGSVVLLIGYQQYVVKKKEDNSKSSRNEKSIDNEEEGKEETVTKTKGPASSISIVQDEPPVSMIVQPQHDDVQRQAADSQSQSPRRRVLSPNTITIAHGSVTGTCSKLAQNLAKELTETLVTPSSTSNNNNKTGPFIQMGPLEDWDWWDELLNYEQDEEEESKDNADSSSLPPPVLLVLLPTHHGGSWPSTATCLQTALQDVQNDWRIEKFPLRRGGRDQSLRVGVMGMGCSDYGDDTMGRPAREAFTTLKSLGAQMWGKHVRIGDDAIGNQDRVLQSWLHHDILPRLIVDDDDDDGNDKDMDQNSDSEKENAQSEPDVVDMEDMGAAMASAANENDDDDDEDDDDDDENNGGTVNASRSKSSNKNKKQQPPREMVTETQAKALKKEGYKLIGTHSAVKLCRWTKHQLRGRGGCYKHTFYGITSYQCMEATPSLACANKCVFCWRHHKNPVGKEWKWKTDDPHFIVDEAVKTHVKMIKETRGIPGVNPQRWQEAHTVRHCALSLVGEPIMYPRINELLGDLHERHISSFLVTNGQHPQAISSLIPVTQLYVSVDAPTPESLVAIDRPLFADAWDRLKESLSLLRDKGQRTVARLTVVKGWNSDEVQGYAKLIALGKVSLVEVKGVTFCGKSDASNLNMSNTPWHHEVVDLVQNLKLELDRLRQAGGPDAPPEYDLACEHKHSVSVLLARVDQFAEERPNGERVWKTWINYPKFQELSARHAADPTFTFSVKEYTAETPAWALFGSEEEGFDPTDTRHRKKKKYPKYTKFDDHGIPTHDHNHEPISEDDRRSLRQMMDDKIKQVGCGSTVTELKGGEKYIQDASLMFRGQVIVK